MRTGLNFGESLHEISAATLQEAHTHRRGQVAIERYAKREGLGVIQGRGIFEQGGELRATALGN